MTIPLQKTIIYGPVHSRRLGHSLDINLFGTEVKLCSFNCVYCQYGWTKTAPGPDSSFQVTPSRDIFKALEETLGYLPSKPKYITFSGNGEPTLHPDFLKIVEGVIPIRNRLTPDSKVAILSNASTAGRPEIQTALSMLDVRIMKLDAGTDRTFRQFNRAMIDIDLKGIVQGLISLDDVTIQTLFANGPIGNCAQSEIQEWIGCLKAIKPTSVQIYTLDRSYPSADIEPVSQGEMERIHKRLEETGICSAVY
jgi:wyosine [tRNA(Phe)-imidazoG37] synthetase (radical SAM superfamily)